MKQLKTPKNVINLKGVCVALCGRGAVVASSFTMRCARFTMSANNGGEWFASKMG